jgi:hypothetical protein
MKYPNVVIAACFLSGIAWAGSTVARAADLSGDYRRVRSMRVQTHVEAAVGTTGCGWNCRSACPDGYSCYPLYGNFRLPYGNPTYWTRYTAGGWN